MGFKKLHESFTFADLAMKESSTQQKPQNPEKSR